jgi:hypothetical protein
MIIPAEKLADRIRLIAIENMKGAFGNEGALLPFLPGSNPSFPRKRTLENVDMAPLRSTLLGKIVTTFGLQFP